MRPTLRCVLLFAGGIPVALLSAVLSERLWTFWLAYLGLALLACGVDLILGLPRRHLDVEVEAPGQIYIGDRAPLVVKLTAFRRHLAPIEILADLDRRLAPQPRRSVRIPPTGEALCEIPLVPLRRGRVEVERLWLRWTGPLGLIRRAQVRSVGLEVPVVPNVGAVRSAALRFFTAREYLSGLKVERYVGEGSEFESLREYLPGLDHRAMNWKASARHRKLLCTEFRAERNHQVVLALDTGHLMREPMASIPKLDHAINAGLLLTYVCLRTGDRVGWFTFDESVHSFHQPVGGPHAFFRLQRRSADIEYSYGETNFTLGLAELSTRLRRRSLVVLLTDFVDTISAELMLESLARLSRRHLVLFVTLRDPGITGLADRRPDSLAHLYRSVVAADFVRERELVLRRLARLGVQCLDTPPARITTELLNRYLDIKRRELF